MLLDVRLAISCLGAGATCVSASALTGPPWAQSSGVLADAVFSGGAGVPGPLLGRLAAELKGGEGGTRTSPLLFTQTPLGSAELQTAQWFFLIVVTVSVLWKLDLKYSVSRGDEVPLPGHPVTKTVEGTCAGRRGGCCPVSSPSTIL